jgi:glucokinase
VPRETTDVDVRTPEALPLVVGVDLGGTQIRAAVLRGAKRLSRVGRLTGEDPAPERVIPRMFDTVHQALAEANVELSEIAGIGIGAPGPLDGHSGIVFCPPNLPGWKDVPLRDIFAAELKAPIYLENDANAAGLGEYMFGAGLGYQDAVYLTISTGIGGGIIANGRLLSGSKGTAGELGHMTIDRHGPRCNCGNIGCLESLASGTAIARRANERIALGQADGAALLEYALTHQRQEQSTNTPEDRHSSLTTPIHVNARMVAEAAQAGIPLAREIIADAADALGFGLVNVIHIFNPQVIILGGGVVQIGDPLLEPARQVVKERAMSVPRDTAQIALAQLGTDAGLVGAGALVYYHQKQLQDQLQRQLQKQQA